MMRSQPASEVAGRLRTVRRDLAALGPMAPVRAAYEVAKRSGAHGVLLRRFVDRARPRRLVTLDAFAMPDQVSDATRERTLSDARAILADGHRAFGRRFPVQQRSDWISLPGTELHWPANSFWWDIDVRTDQRLGDVKWTWELGRHRDLVVLARAAALERDGLWLDSLETRLRDWFDISQPEVGIHWYSNLEVALRMIAWIQIHALVGDRLDLRLLGTMADHVSRAERHLMFDFPYTASSMRNNHLLGDALGIIAIDRFTGGDGSRRPARLAERFFLAQLKRHMHSDGSMIEDSLAYHRFVLEMLIVRVLLGGAEPAVARAMRGAAAHLRTLGALDGEVPQYGDWDEGRVLADSAPAGSVAGSTWLGLALSGQAPPNDTWAMYDELAWYVTPSSEASVATIDVAAMATTGGFTTVREGPWHVWFKTGSGSSHQHADVSAVYVRRGESWLICDPGTGTYNGPLEVRNGFRTSNGHPVWHPVGADQMDPHRAFRWLRSVRGYSAPPLRRHNVVVLFGWHDAFEREGNGGRVARAVVVTQAGVLIWDFIENERTAEPWRLTVPLPPDGRVDQFFGLEAAVVIEGQLNPFGGWHSATYGDWGPSKWLTLETTGTELPIWGVGHRPEGVRLGVTWMPNLVTLDVTETDHSYTMRASRA